MNKKGKLSVSALVGIIVSVLIAVAMVPAIASNVAMTGQHLNGTKAKDGWVAGSNVTGAASALIVLVPMLFVVLVVIGAVAYVKHKK